MCLVWLPDIAAHAMLDRVKEIEPKALFAGDGFIHGDGIAERIDEVAE